MDRKPILPVRGATSGSTYRGTPAGFTAWQALRNIRVFGTDTDRPRFSRRPCLEPLVLLKNGAPVQGVISVSRASAVSGYVLGTCAGLSGEISALATGLVGQVAGLDDVPSMEWFAYLDVTGSGGAAGNSVSAVAAAPDASFLAVASNYTVGGFGRFTVARLSPDTGAVAWQTTSSEASKSRSVNDILVTRLYTFVAIANSNTASGAPKIIAYRNDTGAQAWTHDVNGWANEGVALALWTDPADDQEYLFLAYNGSPKAGTYHGGVGGGAIKYGRWGLQFRSAIRRYRVNGGAYGPTPAARTTFGTQLAATDDYFDTTGGNAAPHGDWRLSEQNIWAPHGGEFTALATGPDGSVFFTKRNQGWGPNDMDARFQPDGFTEQYTTAGKISPAGALVWMSDTDSIREADDRGFLNDLTFPGDTSPDASIQALAVSPDGDSVYCSGRRNSLLKSVYALGGEDGVYRWSANVMSATAVVREGCAAVDADGHFLTGGDRNTGWDGAAGASANLWKLDKNTGAVIWAWDMSKAVSCLGVAALGDGRVYPVFDKVT